MSKGLFVVVTVFVLSSCSVGTKNIENSDPPKISNTERESSTRKLRRGQLSRSEIHSAFLGKCRSYRNKKDNFCISIMSKNRVYMFSNGKPRVSPVPFTSWYFKGDELCLKRQGVFEGKLLTDVCTSFFTEGDRYYSIASSGSSAGKKLEFYFTDKTPRITSSVLAHWDWNRKWERQIEKDNKRVAKKKSGGFLAGLNTMMSDINKGLADAKPLTSSVIHAPSSNNSSSSGSSTTPSTRSSSPSYSSSSNTNSSGRKDKPEYGHCLKWDFPVKYGAKRAEVTNTCNVILTYSYCVMNPESFWYCGKHNWTGGGAHFPFDPGERRSIPSYGKAPGEVRSVACEYADSKDWDRRTRNYDCWD